MIHMVVAYHSAEMREQLSWLVKGLARELDEEITMREVKERPHLVTEAVQQGLPDFLIIHEDFAKAAGHLWLQSIERSSTVLVMVTQSKYRQPPFAAVTIPEATLARYGSESSFSELLEELRAAAGAETD